MSPRHKDDDEQLPATPTASPEKLHERVSELENGHKDLHAKMETISLSVYWVNAIKGIIIGSGPFVAALLTWGVWITDGIYDFKGFMSQGPRFTATDANNLELRVNAHTDLVVNDAIKPIQESVSRIDTQGTTRGQTIYTDVEVLKRQMQESTVDRARINTKLDTVIEQQRELKLLLERVFQIQQKQQGATP